MLDVLEVQPGHRALGVPPRVEALIGGVLLTCYAAVSGERGPCDRVRERGGPYERPIEGPTRLHWMGSAIDEGG